MWQIQVPIDPPGLSFTYKDSFLSIGSCFADQVGRHLKNRYFDIDVNPTGVMYNAHSIKRTFELITGQIPWDKADVFFNEGLWRHYDIHSRLCNKDKNIFIENTSAVLNNLQSRLKNCRAVFLTLGTSFVWQLSNSAIVANCHKMPAHLFERRMLSIDENRTALINIRKIISEINPSCHIILTVSPIRHLRDGIVQNNRSKARLIEAAQDVVDQNENVKYFPSYEILLDELRNYRFYCQDMVHPSEAAVTYIFNRFYDLYFTEVPQRLTQLVEKINRNVAHKAVDSKSSSFDAFRKRTLQLVDQIETEFEIDLSAAVNKLTF